MTSKGLSPGQLPLPFSRFERFEFELFHPGEHIQAVSSLKQTACGEATQNIYLWGQKGCGKSHLLQAACTLASDTGNSAAYIPLGQLYKESVELLSGLEQLDLICIDDLDCIKADKSWEQALFSLYNDRRENNKPLIFSACESPRGIRVKMPDLKSRLSWDLIYHLTPLDETALITALKHRASSRMFDLPDDVIQYLVKRVSRDTHTLFGVLDKLDEASLQSKKKITIPFVKRLLDAGINH